MSWLSRLPLDADSAEQDTTLLIVCEGSDGVGKTTLVQEIVEQLHASHSQDVIEVRHKGPPSQHPLDEYVMPLRSYRPGTGHHIVCDRWHLGELVYPQIFRRSTEFNRAQRWYVDWFLRSRGAFLAHIYRDHIDVLETIATRGDDLVTADQVLPIALSYEAAARLSKLEKRSYDIREGAVAASVIYAAEHTERQVVALNAFTTYVGPHDPILLLLGDVRGPASTHPRDPAFAPYPASSGAFLLKALTSTALEISPSFIGVANACDVDSVPDMLETLKPMHVVTLGQNAAKKLDKLGISFGAAPHPQYVRRFHHAASTEYGGAINVAATLQRDLRSWRP